MSAKVAPLTSLAPFDGTDTTMKMLRIYFTVAPLGNYAALGDTLDFTLLGDLLISGYVPVFVYIQSASSGGVSGYEYAYTPAAVPTLANGKFQVLQGANGAPNADIGAGAYPAAVLADTIVGYADFLRL